MASYQELQRAFVDRLGGASVSDLENGTIVVIPSATFALSELQKIVGIARYEERLLCMLLWLRRPGLRMVYVTSLPVDQAVLEYYLGFLPDPDDAGRRLTMLTLDDPDPEALAPKLVRRPDVLDALAASAGPADQAYLLPFNVTEHERVLSERVQLPVYGPTPEAAALGSKTGSRRIARQAGVAVLPGEEDLRSVADLDAAVERLRGAGAVAAVAKLNNGFSGQGNAILDLQAGGGSVLGCPTVFCAGEEAWPSFSAKMQAEGAIVEELVRRAGTVSPSVQMRIAPNGAVEVVSTHDQILGGPENQVYLGCRFPASADYRLVIQEQAVWVAEALAAEGVMGSFGIDFIVPPDGEVYLSEINLRMGGTTHPFWMTRLATQGTYDADTGELVTNGQGRCYVASDNLKSATLLGRSPADIIIEVRRRGWAFDPERGAGVTVHLLGALPEHGKMGVTCIAPTMDEADALFTDVSTALMGGRPT
ncbi:MAG: hypothetical protein QOG87_1651 [Actinomycetota bacterium]